MPAIARVSIALSHLSQRRFVTLVCQIVSACVLLSKGIRIFVRYFAWGMQIGTHLVRNPTICAFRFGENEATEPTVALYVRHFPWPLVGFWRAIREAMWLAIR